MAFPWAPVAAFGGSIIQALSGSASDSMSSRLVDRQNDYNTVMDATSRERFLADRAHAEGRDDRLISRRVQDAKNAGVSPLAALGAAGSAVPAYNMPGAGRSAGVVSGSGRGALGAIGAGVAAAGARMAEYQADEMEIQVELAKLRLAEREMQLTGHARMAEARGGLVGTPGVSTVFPRRSGTITRGPIGGKRKKLWELYDAVVPRRGKNEVILLSEPAAESLESLPTAGAAVGAMTYDQGRSWFESLKRIFGD